MLLASIAISWIIPVGPILSALELPPKPLSELKSEEFRIREKAQADLVKWGRGQPDAAMEELFRQSRVAKDPEVRERCLGILRELVIDEYLKDGEGYIGIRMRDEMAEIPGDKGARGVIRVVEVVPNSAAEISGLQVNDLIAGLDEMVWREAAAAAPFSERIRQLKPNTKILLKLVRNGALIDLKVVLGRRPLIADNPFLMEQPGTQEATERAAKEAYFTRWLERRKMRD